MHLYQNRKIQVAAAATLLLAAAGWGAVFFLSPTRGDRALNPAGTPSTGFTFFDIGSQTLFSEGLRKSIEDKLGSGVAETRGTIDLRPQDGAFLETHFSEIFGLHQALNDPGGARIEHDITRLTHRYALKKNTPFYYVELVFSNDSKKPLYFRIKAKKEGAGIIDEIKAKYGAPRKIESATGAGATLFWKNGPELLLVSQMKDRFDQPEFHLMIYFTDALHTLVSTEREMRKQREEIREKSVRRAF